MKYEIMKAHEPKRPILLFYCYVKWSKELKRSLFRNIAMSLNTIMKYRIAGNFRQTNISFIKF